MNQLDMPGTGDYYRTTEGSALFVNSDLLCDSTYFLLVLDAFDFGEKS